ncbi:DJ-1/PfpI family protein [Paenibacillus wulumuqiensis]|uniref:DJ-1/PfpI family protein n=1 Tax=Paenibacillus wulumuqiensis TaxID=1567107 RepID=UPI00061939C0|nr:DJ-1/PfpI family protein [Paenibacillus wulumuqiensis]
MNHAAQPVYHVGLFLFNEVEVLDFAGPFEVFSITVRSDQTKAFRVHTVSADGQMITARNGLQVQPEYSFATLPPVDILIIPGGYGAEEIEIHKPEVIDWIRSHANQERLVASICTGALLLAEAGLLDGRSATTHWMDLERLARDYPRVNVRSGMKYIDEGRIMTSGGISAGIHLSLHIVSSYLDMETARMTARRMEYDWGE